MNFVKVRVQLSWWDFASPWGTLTFTDSLSVETDDVVTAANFVSGPRGPTVNGIDFTESIPSPPGGAGPVDETYIFALPPGLFPVSQPITARVDFLQQEFYELPAVTISLSEDNITYVVAGSGMGGDEIPLSLVPVVASDFWTDHKGTRELNV